MHKCLQNRSIFLRSDLFFSALNIQLTLVLCYIIAVMAKHLVYSIEDNIFLTEISFMSRLQSKRRYDKLVIRINTQDKRKYCLSFFYSSVTFVYDERNLIYLSKRQRLKKKKKKTDDLFAFLSYHSFPHLNMHI